MISRFVFFLSCFVFFLFVTKVQIDMHSSQLINLFKRKAVYDLLIEFSLAAKLIPTNYTLKLYHQEENDILNGIGEDSSKIIDYTPNQTIGQLSMCN